MRSSRIRRIVSFAAALMTLALAASPAWAPTAAADGNVAPTVTATVSLANAEEPQTVFASATFTDPESATETYTCSILYGDGIGPVAGIVSGMTCTGPAHQYLVTGSYMILVTVTDSGGASGAGMTGTHYTNDPPTLPAGMLLLGQLDAGDVVYAGAIVVDSGSGWGGTPIETYSCSFDYGDGSGAQAGTYVPLWNVSGAYPGCVGPNHVYATAGVYTITLVARDSGGATATVSTTKTIAEASSPVVTPPADQYVSSAQSAAYGGLYPYSLGSFTDPHGAAAGPWTWTVTWETGATWTGYANSQGPLTAIRALIPGTHRGHIEVRNSGGWTGAADFNVTVSGDMFVQMAPSQPATEGVPTTINYYFWDPYVSGGYAIHVDFGDGTSGDNSSQTGVAPSLSHTYAASDSSPSSPGITVYTATITVKDALGHTGSASEQIGVQDVAPAVYAPAIAPVPEGTIATITLAQFADASVGPWHVRIDGGPGLQSDELVTSPGLIQIPYDSSWGDRTFTITVGDRGGLISTVTNVVHVANHAPVVGQITIDGDVANGQPLEGGSVAVHASFVDAGLVNGTETFTCTVDYGDGAGPVAGQIQGGICSGPVHKYGASGSGSIWVSVTDSNSATGYGHLNYTLVNVAPSVTAYMSDYNPREWHADPSASSAVTAYATFTDPGSAAETYSCSVNYGDGTVVLGVVSGLTCTGPLHQYLVSGTYKVTVTVIDNGGASGVGTTGATYQNWAPWVGGGLVGSFTVGSVVNDVAAIVDPGAAFETYTCTVDYGDGTGVHAGTYVPNGWSDGLPRCVGPDHVYQAPGSYSIITTATDSAGATGSSLVIETIIRTPIVVGPVSVSGTAFVGSPFSASATFTQSGQTNACTVDYGDGSGPVAGVVTGSACQGPQHTYTAVGSFTISISVSDSNGGLGSSSLTVTTQVAPQVGPVVAPSPLVEGQAFVASASFSALAPARCTVDFGNGTGTSFGSISGSTCSAPNYMYPAPGTYTLTFTITDARGFTATAGATVVIGNVAPVVYDLLTSGTPSAGGVVTAQANFSHPALGIDTYACTIDFGDGTSPETGVIGDADCTADHTYSQGGLYTVTMTVTDNTGGSGSASVSEPIANLRPTVGPITVSGALTENGVVHASASFTDPWSVANYYMCSVDYGDGHGWTVWVATDHACIDAPMHFYDDAGTFTVTLEVDRGYGEVAIATTTVTVANVAPTVVPIYAPVPEQSGVSWVPSVGFTDPGSLGAETYACTIDFGDGTGAMAGVISGIVCTGPSHSYASKGSYTMVATVTDSHGASGTYSVTIVIYNAAPTVGPVVAPASAVVGSAVVASAGYVSTGLAPADTCTVDYGDGSGPLAGTADGAKCTGPGHKYAATGTFTIVVKLQAANGAAATSSATIKVSSLQVGAVSVNGTLLEGSSVVASAGFTPVGSQTYKCKVDYGDGSGAQTGTISGTTCKGPSHKYGGPGSFTISVSVTGSKGNTGASTMTVVVANVLPVVTATLPSTAKIGTLVTLSASFTDPGTTETYQVVVDWNDGSGRIPIQLHGRSFSASHTYTKAGDYPVVVEVSDDQGAHAVTAVPQVAIYDPARSVSGSGTFASPAGACTLTSKCVGASTATFSLSAAYAKGATVPTGTFTFSAAGISFTATSFDWYMAPDGVGILYGHGKVNGVSGYHFSVVTLDGSPDKILVDLVGADGFSVYHNGDYTPLKTGSITMK